MLQPTKRKKTGRVVTVKGSSQPEGRVTTKITTKRLKSGEIRRYRYYQLVASARKGKKVKHRYLRYLGKLPPPHVTANQRDLALEASGDWFFRVNPERAPIKARCARCGQEFTLIWFEREMGQKLCPRCRA